MTQLPPDAEVFHCNTIPNCDHDRSYVCTPRDEDESCRGNAGKMASRGACKRACHFIRSCDAYRWDVSEGRCFICSGSSVSLMNHWSFRDDRFSHDPIVEWHHGWFFGDIKSIWTGNIDLVISGYIYPRPLDYKIEHILLPGNVTSVSYTFTGHNCLVVPWKKGLMPQSKRMPLNRSPEVQGETTAIPAMIFAMIIVLILIILKPPRLRSFLRRN